MSQASKILIGLSTANLCMLLGATIYESAVMAPNYVRGTTALKHIRAFFVASNPAKYFRPFSAITQILLLISVVFSFLINSSDARWYLLASFAGLVITDIITFTVHYPRNRVLFVDQLDRPAGEYEKIAREWAAWNMVRIVLLVIAGLASFVALVKL